MFLKEHEKSSEEIGKRFGLLRLAKRWLTIESKISDKGVGV